MAVFVPLLLSTLAKRWESYRSVCHFSVAINEWLIKLKEGRVYFGS